MVRKGLVVKGRQAQVEQCRQVGPWLPLGVGQPPPGSRSPGHPEDAPGVVQLPPSSEPCTPTRQEGIPPPAWISPGVGAAPLPRRQTTKEARDQESEKCLEGLRNPNQAVAANQDLRQVGRRLRRVLEQFLDLNTDCVDVCRRLGTDAAAGASNLDFTEDHVTAIRVALRRSSTWRRRLGSRAIGPISSGP